MNSDTAPQAGLTDPTGTHEVRQLEHDRSLLGCRYHPSGSAVVAGSQDNQLIRWDLAGEDDPRKTILSGHESWVRAVGFSTTAGAVLSGGYDGRLIWWPDTAGDTTPLRTVVAHQGWIQSLDVSADGRLVATGGTDRLVKVFDTESGEQVAELAGHEADVSSVLFGPDGRWLLSGDLVGSIRQWEVATGRQERSLEAEALKTYNAGQRVHYGGVRCLALDVGRNTLWAGGLHKASNPLGAIQEPLVLELDWESAEVRRQLEVGETTRLIANRLLPHPDGYLITICGCLGGFLMFYRPEEVNPFHQHKVAETVFDGDLHHDGLHLATAHDDGRVRISHLAPAA